MGGPSHSSDSGQRDPTEVVVFWLTAGNGNESKWTAESIWDNNASSPMDPRVAKAMEPYYLREFGNASSIHACGQHARAAVERARSQVADLLSARSREVVFTCGGTEADNAAIEGVARRFAGSQGHIITSGIEHPAVLKSIQHLEDKGFRVTCLSAGRKGVVRVEDVAEALSEDTILVSIMHANNEGGHPTARSQTSLGSRALGKSCFTRTRCSPSARFRSTSTSWASIFLPCRDTSFMAPWGSGLFTSVTTWSWNPSCWAGSHERHRRAGTENVPGIVGLGEACRLAAQSHEEMHNRVAGLRDRLEEGILQRLPGCVVNGTPTGRVPHTTNISFERVEGEALLVALDFKGIAVSTGAACSSGSLEPSHVLQAMKLGRNRIQGAIRFSLSRMTTGEDIDYALETVVETVNQIRSVRVG